MSDSSSLLLILGVTLGVSLLGLLGGLFLLWRERFAGICAPWLVSFAAGSILGASFLDLLPESIEASNDDVDLVVRAVLVGIVVFFTLEKLLVWHHHAHGDEP